MTYTHTISVAQLNALRSEKPQTVLFDCRHDLAQPAWGAAQYAASHIRGALFANLDTDLSGAKTASGGRHPLPDRDAFVAWLASKGVAADSTVVVYDQLDGMYAARLWWMCRWAGIQSVAVLAGGYTAWVAQGGKTGAISPSPQPVRAWNLPALETVLSIDQVEANLQTQTFTLIDARAPERYRGEVEPLDPVAGHIPGAVNRFFKRNVTPQGDFAPDLAAQWAALLGDTPAKAWAHSCGSGVSACHNILALHVAGKLAPDQASQLFAGSWSAWCSDTSRPAAKG